MVEVCTCMLRTERGAGVGPCGMSVGSYGGSSRRSTRSNGDDLSGRFARIGPRAKSW